MNKVTLSDVSTLITKGTTPSTVGESFTDTGINFIKSESISDSKYLNSSIYEKINEKTDFKLKRSRLQKDDLLFSIAGAYLGKIAIVRETDVPANTNQAVGIVRLNQEIVDKDYVYYFYSQKSINAYINKLSAQSSQPNLNLDLLGRLPLDLKGIQDQRKIAAILSALDEKIDLNNRIYNELESIAETLYDYWFIQFNFPDKNGNPYKSSGGELIYNKTLKREIPIGWHNSELGNICELYQPKTISEKELSENGTYLVYGANGIIGRYNEYNHTSSMVTITCRGNTCGTINITRPSSWITGNAMVVKPRLANLSIDYLYRLLKWADISTVITGSAQPQITRTNLAPLKIISPDTSVLKKFSKFTEASLEMRMKYLAETEQLTQLRDWVLPMLMNGQVQIA